jgi:4Fe-4S ferredoxin
MFTQNEAFPILIKKISIDKNFCSPDCKIKCEESCPRDAIKTVVEKQDGQVKKISDVQVDEGLCIYCRACEYACPIGIINTKRPFEGLVKIDNDKCPERCHVCADVCPSDAIDISKEGEIEVDKKLCVACKSCQTVCPEQAIHVSIEQVSHTPVKSATWITLLQRFASSSVAMKEMATKSTEKRSLRIQTLPPTA